MHGLAQRVLEYVRRAGLLVPGDRVGIAVSGGADSVALLRILLELRPELGLVLSVVHFNHKLRGAESDSDEAFVSELARAHKLQFRNSSADVRRHSAEHKISVETAARELRHGFFTKLLLGDNSKTGEKGSASVLDKIATAHTLDDQAETVLMRMIRGTGGRGLAGIYLRVKIGGRGAIVRPMLGVRRRELELYLREIGQQWREDATNRELKFTRNRVRHSVLPLLERDFNPAITERLSELAEIARAEEDYWESNAAAWTGAAVQWQAGGGVEKTTQGAPSNAPQPAAVSPASLPNENPRHPCVNRSWLLAEPLALQRRLVKSIGEQADVTLEFKHVDEILRFAADNQPSGKELALPKGWKLLQQGESLLFVAPSSAAAESEDGYEYRFTVPGSVEVREIGSRFELAVVEKATAGYDADDLLDLALLSNPLTVRNWRAGDRFWPARRKSEKKVKELLAELNMPQSERKMWPVIVSANEIVWVRGFPVAAKFRVQGNQRDRIFVREISQG